MAIISKIEAALQQINDAAFQELCNRYLYYKYSPNSISPTGSVIGKEKTRKGTPDAFFLNNDGQFTFIEHTTQEQLKKSKSFFSKIQKDISNCFDESKTNITSADISRVISCHTGKLSASEIKELVKFCTDKNPNCIFEQYGINDIAYGLINYPGLVQEYLDIKIGTGQLMSVPEFVAYYEKPDLKLATPLSNQFLGRKKEINDGLQKLNDNSILIVNGISGAGKSRYALELCDLYVKADSSYKLLCVGNKGHEIYEDLHTQLNKDQNYLFLIDDANRIASNFSFILYLLKENRKRNIRLVITVRDYAAPLINNLVAEFSHQQVQLEPLSDGEITDILKSDSFDIHNKYYIEKILRIARGNARIAVMCALIAKKEQTLDSLNDVSQLYELYFKDAFDKIKEIDEVNVLKVLGLISFFRTISKDHESVNKKIFSIFNIDEDSFWEICYKLHQQEFVDLFNNQVVKISDQTLSTYLFFRIFFDSEMLDFGLLVRHFIEFDADFYDSIDPLLVAYDYKNIKSKLSTIIISYWQTLITEVTHEEVMKVIKIFWFCCEMPSLSYIKKHINILSLSDTHEYSFEYDQNQMSFRVATNHILVLLAEFRHSEYIRMSLELMISYIRKNPHEAGFLAYLLKEKYLFKHTNLLYGDRIQHELVDFLIENIEKHKGDLLYVKIFFEVSANLLKTHFSHTESSGKKFIIYNFGLHLTDSIKELRSEIWEQVWNLYSLNKDSIYDLLLSLDYPREEHEDAVWQFDAEIVLPSIINNLDYHDFRACEAAHHYFEIIDRRKITTYDKILKQKATNKLYKLSRLLSREYQTDWKKDVAIRRKKINKYCQNFDFNRYIKLLDDLAYIKTIKNSHFSFDSDISQIIADIALKDIDLFLEVLGYAIANYDFSYHTYLILNTYFQQTPNEYKPVFECIEGHAKNKQHWLLAFHACIPENLIKDNYLYLINHFFSLLNHEPYFWGLSDILDKYCNYASAKDLYVQTVSILNSQPIDTSKKSFSTDPDFFKKAFNYSDEIFKEYCQLYYKCKGSEKHYDYNNEILKMIISYKPDEVVNFFKTVYGNARASYEIEKERMCFIWDLDDYKKILKLCIEYFMGLDFFYHKEEAIFILFTDLDNNTEKAHLFIREMIEEYFDNDDYIYMVFLITASCLGKYKCEYIQQYLTLKPDFDAFKKLCFFPTHRSYAGSRIPYIRKEIEEWEEIISSVKELTPAINYLEHIEYLESHIRYCERDIEWEAKREFQDGYRL